MPADRRLYESPAARRPLARWLLVAIAALALAAEGRAQTLFDFLSEETGEPLARLEVLNFPASDPSDFGALTFTPAGDALLGFGLTYESSFDIFDGGPLIFMNNEPRAVTVNPIASTLVDTSIPNTSLSIPDPEETYFLLSFPELGSAAPARMIVGHSLRSETYSYIGGFWRLVVPEPGACSLLLLAVLANAGSRRR